MRTRVVSISVVGFVLLECVMLGLSCQNVSCWVCLVRGFVLLGLSCFRVCLAGCVLLGLSCQNLSYWICLVRMCLVPGFVLFQGLSYSRVCLVGFVLLDVSFQIRPFGMTLFDLTPRLYLIWIKPYLLRITINFL